MGNGTDTQDRDVIRKTRTAHHAELQALPMAKLAHAVVQGLIYGHRFQTKARRVHPKGPPRRAGGRECVHTHKKRPGLRWWNVTASHCHLRYLEPG